MAIWVRCTNSTTRRQRSHLLLIDSWISPWYTLFQFSHSALLFPMRLEPSLAKKLCPCWTSWASIFCKNSKSDPNQPAIKGSMYSSLPLTVQTLSPRDCHQLHVWLLWWCIHCSFSSLHRITFATSSRNMLFEACCICRLITQSNLSFSTRIRPPSNMPSSLTFLIATTTSIWNGPPPISRVNEMDIPFVGNMFRYIESHFDSEFYGYINSDNILSSTIFDVLVGIKKNIDRGVLSHNVCSSARPHPVGVSGWQEVQHPVRRVHPSQGLFEVLRPHQQVLPRDEEALQRVVHGMPLWVFRWRRTTSLLRLAFSLAATWRRWSSDAIMWTATCSRTSTTSRSWASTPSTAPTSVRLFGRFLIRSHLHSHEFHRSQEIQAGEEGQVLQLGVLLQHDSLHLRDES